MLGKVDDLKQANRESNIIHMPGSKWEVDKRMPSSKVSCKRSGKENSINIVIFKLVDDLKQGKEKGFSSTSKGTA